ncbi:hypothetical protein D9M68_921830 [compost metagenome]
MEADEVAAKGRRPGRNFPGGESFLEYGFHCIKARRQNVAMLLHQVLEACEILQEGHVAKLIDLVGADTSKRDMAQPPGDVFRRAPKQCQAGSCERHL